MKALVIFGVVAFITTLLGSALLIINENWGKRHLWRLLALGSGVLLGIAFLHLFPESFELAGKIAPMTVLLTFAFLFAAENVTMVHACEGFLHPSESKVVPYTASAALFVHAMVDGLAIGLGLHQGILVGSVISMGVILHKFADGLTLTSLLRAFGFQRNRSILLAVLLALATPLGAILSYYGVGHLSDYAVGIFMAATAGSFIYVGAADLLPRIHEIRDRYCIIFFLIGLAAVGSFF